MSQISLTPLAPLYGRSQKNIPLAPMGYGQNSQASAPRTSSPSGPTPIGTPASQRERANSINQSKAYENDAFNKWFGGLHPDEAAKFAPQFPTGRLSTTDKTGKVTINDSSPEEIASGQHQQQLAAARAHFRANVLPSDQGYRALQSQANPQTGLVPLDPRIQAAQIAADARTQSAQIAAGAKPGMGERMLTGLGSGLKDLAGKVIQQSGATARNDATNQTRTDIAGQNNATRTGIAGQNNDTKTNIAGNSLAAKGAEAASKQPPLSLQEKADYATWEAQMRSAISQGQSPPPLPPGLHSRLSPQAATPRTPPPTTPAPAVQPAPQAQPAPTNAPAAPAAAIQGTGTPSGLPSNRPVAPTPATPAPTPTAAPQAAGTPQAGLSSLIAQHAPKGVDASTLEATDPNKKYRDGSIGYHNGRVMKYDAKAGSWSYADQAAAAPQGATQ